MACETDGVRATVKEAIVADIRIDLDRILKQNITTKKELHSLIGKLGHAVGLLIIMRPFLEPLWAALSCNEKATGAPANTI